MSVVFSALPEGGTTTVKSGKDAYGQTQREAKTRWVLGKNPEGHDVVVDLTTRHRSESKSFYSSLTWKRVESTKPGSAFVVETWGSDHISAPVRHTAVARYSQKALEAEHEAALEVLKEHFNMVFAAVFEQASLFGPLGVEVDA